MDVEKCNTNERVSTRTSNADSFNISSAREVLSLFNTLEQLGPDPKETAILSSLKEFEQQLKSTESLYGVQTFLALEFGLHGALAEGCTTTGVNVVGLTSDPHAAVSNVADVFSVIDNLMDREHVRALAWQANCTPEAVRKDHGAFQKAVSDRLSLAAKRAKVQGQDALPSAASGLLRVAPVHNPSAAPAAGPATQSRNSNPKSPPLPLLPPPPPPKLSHPQQHQQRLHQASGVVVPAVDERLYCLDEQEDAARKAQLAKLSTLVNPETGGICSVPISAVGVFQQQMAICTDWRVRRTALEAMSHTSLDVLWRLLQNSRMLDCLTTWLQEAQADQQFTMVRLLLDTMACLPMRRDLLKGSRLEGALEALASTGCGTGQRGGGGGGGGGDDSGPSAAMRCRFGGAAAAVLAEWRKDPDHATILRRVGAVAVIDVAAPTAAAAGTAATNANTGGGGGAAAAATPLVRGSRLLGAAVTAAKDSVRKRSLPAPRSLGEARVTPRPRVMDAGGQAAGAVTATSNAATASTVATAAAASAGSRGLAASGGAGTALKRGTALVSTAAASLSVPAPAVDMTAKLGEKGPADPDVVAGFRSRFGDGSVRRSQLARPARMAASASQVAAAATVTAAAPNRESSPGPAEPATNPATAADGTAAAAPEDVSEPGPAELARLRAERAAQRHAAALLALQSEARKHQEVAAAEQEHQERLAALRPVLAARQAERQRRLTPEEVRRAHQSMMTSREGGQHFPGVPWDRPPPELLLPVDRVPTGTGEESVEKVERARARQLVPKVTYPSSDRIPDSPLEPPSATTTTTTTTTASGGPQQQQHQQTLRSVPWMPSAEEDGGLDWFRQNRILWDRGWRRADHVLPPALLHKHLELDAALLPPHFNPPPPPSALPAVPIPKYGLIPQPYQPQQPQLTTEAPLHPHPPHPHPSQLPAPVLQPPQVPPPVSLAPAWERPPDPPAPQQRSSHAPAPIILAVTAETASVVAGAPVQTIQLPPPPQQQPHLHAQPPLPPQVPYDQALSHHDFHAARGGGIQQQQQPYEVYGHMNGHPALAPVRGGPYGQALDGRPPYIHPGNGGELPPPPPPPSHGKLGGHPPPPHQPPPYSHHHTPPPHHQVAEPGQNHPRYDVYGSYGHVQNGHSMQHDGPAQGNGVSGDYRTAAGAGPYGGRYGQQQEQPCPDYPGGRREPWERGGHQQSWEYGGGRR